MKCDEFTSALDAYIDGELSADDARAMCEHAKGCAACGDELKRAEFLRDALRNIDADVFVPLEAQAAWRSAVKRERARKKKNTWLRSLTAAAAAAVVLVGSVTLIGNRQNDLNTDSGMDGVMLESAANPADDAQSQETALMIASDGESADIAENTQDETDYACWKKIHVADLDAACDALEQIASEYDGSVTREDGIDRQVTYRVELPGEYLNDFAAAVGGIGDIRDSEVREGDFDPAIAYVLLFE